MSQIVIDVVSKEANAVTSKWIWQMDYCKSKGWNPADSYFWRLSEDAYSAKAQKAEAMLSAGKGGEQP